MKSRDTFFRKQTEHVEVCRAGGGGGVGGGAGAGGGGGGGVAGGVGVTAAGAIRKLTLPSPAAVISPPDWPPL